MESPVAELGTLVKQIQVMKNHYRAFEKAEEVLTGIQSLDTEVKELTSKKASLIGAIARLEDAYAAADDRVKVAERSADERVQAAEDQFNIRVGELQDRAAQAEAAAKARVEEAINKLAAATADHDQRMNDMRIEEEQLAAKLQKTRGKADRLRAEVSKLNIG